MQTEWIQKVYKTLDTLGNPRKHQKSLLIKMGDLEYSRVGINEKIR